MQHLGLELVPCTVYTNSHSVAGTLQSQASGFKKLGMRENTSRREKSLTLLGRRNRLRLVIYKYNVVLYIFLSILVCLGSILSGAGKYNLLVDQSFLRQFLLPHIK